MKKIFRYWIIYGLIELTIYIGLFFWIGFLPLLFIQLISTVCGIFMLRRMGGLLFRNLKGFLLMSPYWFESIFFFLAAFLLIIPGILTTILGLTLFIPTVRRYVEFKFKNKVKKRPTKNASHFDM